MRAWGSGFPDVPITTILGAGGEERGQTPGAAAGAAAAQGRGPGKAGGGPGALWAGPAVAAGLGAGARARSAGAGAAAGARRVAPGPCRGPPVGTAARRGPVALSGQLPAADSCRFPRSLRGHRAECTAGQSGTRGAGVGGGGAQAAGAQRHQAAAAGAAGGTALLCVWADAVGDPPA